MQTDAKLGMLAGLAAVLVAAVVYFQKPAVAESPGKPATAGTSAVPPSVPPAAVKVPPRPVSKANADLDD